MHVPTISQSVNTNKLSQAIFILETLSDLKALLVLETLKEHTAASFFELCMYTGLSSELLEIYLESLCQAGIVLQEESGLELHFSLDMQRLLRAQAIAKELAREAAF